MIKAVYFPKHEYITGKLLAVTTILNSAGLSLALCTDYSCAHLCSSVISLANLDNLYIFVVGLLAFKA